MKGPKGLTNEFYGFTKSWNVKFLLLIPIELIVHLQQSKEMESSKQGMWKRYHLSIKGIRKGFLSREKMVYKRVRGWTLEPVQKFVEYPPSPPPPHPRPGQDPFFFRCTTYTGQRCLFYTTGVIESASYLGFLRPRIKSEELLWGRCCAQAKIKM